jgi:hypothetical protein
MNNTKNDERWGKKIKNENFDNEWQNNNKQ